MIRNNAKRGFTLAELVVASTLMSIVMIGVYTTFHTAILHWRAGSANEKTYTDARRIFTIMENDLSGIPNDPFLVDATRYFIGNDNELTFASVIRPMNVKEEAIESLHIVRYSLNNNTLIREEAPIEGSIIKRMDTLTDLSDDPTLELGRSYERVIADDVLAIRYTYLWRPDGPTDRNDVYWTPVIERPNVTSMLPPGLRIEILIHDPAKDSEAPYTRFTKTLVFDGFVSNFIEDLDDGEIPDHDLFDEDGI